MGRKQALLLQRLKRVPACFLLLCRAAGGGEGRETGGDADPRDEYEIPPYPASMFAAILGGSTNEDGREGEACLPKIEQKNSTRQSPDWFLN